MLIVRQIAYAALFGGIVCVGIPLLIITQSTEFAVSELVKSIGYVLLFTGIAVCIWCALMFPTAGEGTSAPFDPAQKLVVKGMYCFCRNPMYLGGMAILLGEALIFGSVWLVAYTALFAVAAHLLVVYYEEPNLSKKFGKAYEKYKSDTARWIPRWPGS